MGRETKQDAGYGMTENAGEMSFALSGEIDHHSAKGLREAIDEEIMLKNPQTVVLNFAKVGFMDSSGLGLVLGRYRTCQNIGAEMVLQSGNPMCRRIFDMAGLERMEGLKVEGISKTEKKVEKS